MANKRKIIVHIATSADGYIARPDGDLEWLTKRPAPKGFYGDRLAAARVPNVSPQSELAVTD